jgi:uncharacterized protein (TIGR02284 family)
MQQHKPENNMNREIVRLLSELISVCKETENRFKAAAEYMDDPEIKENLLEISEQKRDFAKMLDEELKKMAIDNFAAGPFEFEKIDFKKKLPLQHDSDVLLKEMITSEINILQKYEVAVQSRLPAGIKSLLMSQYGGVKETFYRIKIFNISSRNEVYC